MTSNIEKISEKMVMLYLKVMRSLRDKKITKLGLSAPQIIILLSLHEMDCAKVSDLARERGVSVPTMTGVIDRMEQAGYLKRTANKNDRRQVLIKLTPKGKNTVDKILQTVRKKWSGFAAALTEPERRSYASILQKLIKVAETRK